MTYKIIHGDCFEELKKLPDHSVDSVVTDPPYGLSKEPDIREVLTKWLNGEDYKHRGGGFMGKTWDSFVPGPSVWREVYRVLKPGGHALVFAGTRTQDLMTISLRLAGFEVRDVIEWLYFSGFPKSLDVSKAFDKRAGVEREKIGQATKAAPTYHTQNVGEKIARIDTYDITAPATDLAKKWNGWGTALKPAHEPIILARKPLIGTVAENVERFGTGAINIDGCRIPLNGEKPPSGSGKREGNGNTYHLKDWVAPNGGNGGNVTPEEGRFPANCVTTEPDAFSANISTSRRPNYVKRHRRRTATARWAAASWTESTVTLLASLPILWRGWCGCRHRPAALCLIRLRGPAVR